MLRGKKYLTRPNFSRNVHFWHFQSPQSIPSWWKSRFVQGAKILFHIWNIISRCPKSCFFEQPDHYSSIALRWFKGLHTPGEHSKFHNKYENKCFAELWWTLGTSLPPEYPVNKPKPWWSIAKLKLPTQKQFVCLTKVDFHHEGELVWLWKCQKWTFREKMALG